MAKRRALGRALTGFADAFMPAWEGMERRKRLEKLDTQADADRVARIRKDLAAENRAEFTPASDIDAMIADFQRSVGSDYKVTDEDRAYFDRHGSADERERLNEAIRLMGGNALASVATPQQSAAVLGSVGLDDWVTYGAPVAGRPSLLPQTDVEASEAFVIPDALQDKTYSDVLFGSKIGQQAVPQEDSPRQWTTDPDTEKRDWLDLPEFSRTHDRPPSDDIASLVAMLQPSPMSGLSPLAQTVVDQRWEQEQELLSNALEAQAAQAARFAGRHPAPFKKDEEVINPDTGALYIKRIEEQEDGNFVTTYQPVNQAAKEAQESIDEEKLLSLEFYERQQIANMRQNPNILDELGLARNPDGTLQPSATSNNPVEPRGADDELTGLFFSSATPGRGNQRSKRERQSP